MENVTALKGTIYKIGDTKTFGTGDFRKREFLLNYISGEKDGKKFQEIVKLIAQNNNADKLNGLAIGAEIEVGYQLRGRMWTPPLKDGQPQEEDINFTEAIVVWVQEVFAQQKPEVPAAGQVAQAAQQQNFDPQVDDLPF